METKNKKVASFMAYTVHSFWYKGMSTLSVLLRLFKYFWPIKSLPVLHVATGATYTAIPFWGHFQITSFLPTSQLFILSFSGFSNQQLVTSLFDLTVWFFKLPLDFNLWYMPPGICSPFSSYLGKMFSLLSSISALWKIF